jgi:hypothetical protein
LAPYWLDSAPSHRSPRVAATIDAIDRPGGGSDDLGPQIERLMVAVVA